jgi:hypothetical protein
MSVLPGQRGHEATVAAAHGLEIEARAEETLPPGHDERHVLGHGGADGPSEAGDGVEVRGVGLAVVDHRGQHLSGPLKGDLTRSSSQVQGSGHEITVSGTQVDGRSPAPFGRLGNGRLKTDQANSLFLIYGVLAVPEEG